jgi:hypothetical protein
MTETKQYILGEHDDIIHLESMQDNRDIALSMAQQARRSLHIFTQDLDAPIFDTPSFTSFVRIIVKDTKYAILHGHRIIELARRLSSHIHIRKASIEYKEYSAAYLIADETAYLRRSNGYRYEGIACFNARNDCRHLLEFFNTAWEKAAPDPELRRLHI